MQSLPTVKASKAKNLRKQEILTKPRWMTSDVTTPLDST